MNELTRAIQDEISWCMLFADNIVILDMMRDGVNAKVKLQRRTLESRDFRLSSQNRVYGVQIQ